MSTVLVTGGNGALGRVVIARLRSLGHDVICGTRCPTVYDSECLLDVTDTAQVLDVISSIKPSMIIHLAATFGSDYDAAFGTNVVGAKNIISAIQQLSNTVRLVLAGSAAEYGLISPDENPIREGHILRPVSIYGLTKSWQTNYALMCSYQGLDVVIARIFNIEGPDLSDRLFIGRINRQIQEVISGGRQRIEVGPLSAVRDYITVTDAAFQLIAIAERGVSGQIYHVASGKPTLMRDLLKRHLSRNGLDFGIVDEADALSVRTGYDVPAIYADITRTTALLNE